MNFMLQISSKCGQGGEDFKKSENFADVLYGSPQKTFLERASNGACNEIRFPPFLCVAGTQSAAVKDDEGRDLLPHPISESTTLIMSATVFGGSQCKSDGEKISNESLVIEPGQVGGASVAGETARLISQLILRQ